MHELAICGSIADIVTRRANDRRVEAVHVRIGQLRQIVPDTLSYCWDLVVTDTQLDGTQLDLEQVRALLECHACGQVTEMGDFPLFACRGCESVEVSVVAGEEFMITSLDLAKV